MTYTFKLARRLAVSRQFTMLPILLVLAACGGDATAPEGPTETPTTGSAKTQDLTPVTVQVSPRSVTAETNQLIQFRAHGRTSAGDSVGAAVTWKTSGGTILPDGRFSAAAIGTYTVVGVNRVRGNLQVDTSTVTVVRRTTNLVAIEATPTSVTLAPRGSQTFTAVGRLMSGDVVPIGVNWSATGGSIDAGGTFVAGDTAGTYRVVAINTAGTLADTVQVTISAPPTPPPPAPTPPADPVLAKVILKPVSVTLAPGTKKQFATYGVTTTGDSVSVSVVFKPTGGTVTSAGLYTAGQAAGNFRLIATTGALADTAAITITTPQGSGTPTGIPFGAYDSWAGDTSLEPNTDVFTASIGSVNATNIVARLDAARQSQKHLVLAMTGGSHWNYLTNNVFDLTKWQAKMDTYNTPAIRAAVAAAVSDGTIIGNSVMDEPHVSGLGDGNTWGPPGTMTKARVDQLCAYVKNIFPTMMVGVVHPHEAFEPTKSYQVCEFLVDQYSWRKGDVNTFIEGGLALGRRDGMGIIFSMNLLNGGIQAERDGLWNCSLATTGGRGTFDPNCRMTPQQVREWGILLGSAGCGMMMWKYDDKFMADAGNQQAFRDVADRLASLPAKSCKQR
jgi:hypothetical protein